jgi:hypothetical protein
MARLGAERSRDKTDHSSGNPRDLKALLSSLNANGVEYLLIG